MVPGPADFRSNSPDQAASLPPRDDGLQGQIVLVRGLAEVGVEAMVADGQRVVVSAGLLVLLPPDTAALDQLAAPGAAEGEERGSQGQPLATEKWSTVRWRTRLPRTGAGGDDRPRRGQALCREVRDGRGLSRSRPSPPRCLFDEALPGLSV